MHKFSYLCASKRNIMSKNLLNKYAWLVETIYKAKYISFEEINNLWLENDMSERMAIPKRTFHTWIKQAEELFGIVIQCEHYGDFRYYIEDAEEIKKGGLRNWLLGTMSVNNMLLENKSLSDRILLENIPSGQDFLTTIMAAMKTSHILEVQHKGFEKEQGTTFLVAPYCVKLFRQRWYLLGYSTYDERIRIYSLDRVQEVVMTENTFDYPDDFSPEVYFKDCFGIIHDDGTQVEKVKLKVSARQANYLRSLPMHPSQKEVVRTGDYSLFSLALRPSFDFRQEILWNGDAMEVLEPLWLRNEMARVIKKMWNHYNQQ